MNPSPHQSKTALDELVRRAPVMDPTVLEQARLAAEMMRRLGLLSTEPTEALSPFSRRIHIEPKPVEVSHWTNSATNQLGSGE